MNWFEIPVVDLDRAVAFCSGVLSRDFVHPGGGDRAVLCGGPIGEIAEAQGRSRAFVLEREASVHVELGCERDRAAALEPGGCPSEVVVEVRPVGELIAAVEVHARAPRLARRAEVAGREVGVDVAAREDQLVVEVEDPDRGGEVEALHPGRPKASLAADGADDPLPCPYARRRERRSSGSPCQS